MKVVSNIKVLRKISSYPLGTLFRLRNGEVAKYYKLDTDETTAYVSYGDHSTMVWNSDEPYNGRHVKGLGKRDDQDNDVVSVL